MLYDIAIDKFWGALFVTSIIVILNTKQYDIIRDSLLFSDTIELPKHVIMLYDVVINTF